MPEFKFSPIFRPDSSPADLSIIDKTYNKLEEGHQLAIAKQSEIKAELAKLELNEAEDAWRQQQVDKINAALNDNMRYGNAYSSLDDIIQKYGDIVASTETKGRLRAQQDYKAYIDRIDKSNLNEDYKNYYKEVNKYEYQDIKDKKGNVIGGTKWKPQDEFVNEVPLSAVYDEALKIAAKEHGGGTQTRWLDAKGNVTDDYSQSVTGEFFSSSTGKWERLSKEKLSAAVNAVIEANPSVRASLDQDYKIAKYKFDKYGINPDITDNNGVLLNPNEYLQKRIDPFYKAATFYNQTSETKYGDAWKAQLELARRQTGNGSKPDYPGLGDLSVYTSNPIITDNDFPIEAQATITVSKQGLANIFKSVNPDANIDLNNKTREQMLEMINELPVEKRIRALQYVNDIEDSEEYLNQFKENTINEKENAEFNAYNAIMSLSDLSDNTEEESNIKKKYSGFINKIYKDSTAIRQYFADDDTVDIFIHTLGSDKMASLGIKQGIGSNGKRYFEIPKESYKGLYAFAKAAQFAHDESHNPFGGAWSAIKNKINLSKGDNIVRINSNNEEEPIVGESDEVFGSMVNFVDNLKKSYNKTLDGGKLIRTTTIIPYASPKMAELKMKRDSGEIDKSTYDGLVKDEKAEIINGLRSSHFVQKKIFLVDENEQLIPATTEQAKELTGKFINSDIDDITISTTNDTGSNIPSPVITIGSSDEEDKAKGKYTRFIVVGAYDDKTVQSWKSDTNFCALNDVNKCSSAKRNLRVSDSVAFEGIENFKLVPKGNETWTLYKGSSPVEDINHEMAKSIRAKYLEWKQTYDYVKAGIIPANSPFVSEMIKKTANFYTKLSGGDENLEAYCISKLTDNIIN